MSADMPIRVMYNVCMGLLLLNVGTYRFCTFNLSHYRHLDLRDDITGYHAEMVESPDSFAA